MPCPTEPCSGFPGLSCQTAQILDRVPHWRTDLRGRAGTLCSPVCPCPGPQQLCQSWGAVGSFLPLTRWAGAKRPLFRPAGEPCAHGPTGSCPQWWHTCSRGSTEAAAQGTGSGSPGEWGQGGEGSSRVAGFVCSACVLPKDHQSKRPAGVEHQPMPLARRAPVLPPGGDANG